MSKFTALKKEKTSSATSKIKSSLTADNLSHALEGESDVRKVRKKTNRVVPFSTRVSEEFDNDFRRVAFEKKLKNVELLELALECYKKHEL